MIKNICFALLFISQFMNAQEEIRYLEYLERDDFKVSCNDLDSLAYCSVLSWRFKTAALDSASVVKLDSLIREIHGKDIELHYYDFDYDYSSKSLSKERALSIIDFISKKCKFIECDFILHQKIIKSQLHNKENGLKPEEFKPIIGVILK